MALQWDAQTGGVYTLSNDGLYQYAVYYTPVGWQAARINIKTMDGEVLEGKWADMWAAQNAAEKAEAARIHSTEDEIDEGQFYTPVVLAEDSMDDAYKAFKATPSPENYRHLLGSLADFQAARMEYRKALGSDPGC